MPRSPLHTSGRIAPRRLAAWGLTLALVLLPAVGLRAASSGQPVSTGGARPPGGPPHQKLGAAIPAYQARIGNSIASFALKRARTICRRGLADWAGASEDKPPAELDAAIIYAPVGPLVPLALRAVRKGGRVVCAGIHMSDIPSFPYSILWGERQIVSVANLTRKDGIDFFKAVKHANIQTHTTVFPLDHANDALARLRDGKLVGAAVLRP